ncbi:MAG TPA: hypothetical protein VG099_30360, partial [Gemmataceae bacterium]|nr:hypothetical protein [Gemmataceae bacterium]
MTRHCRAKRRLPSSRTGSSGFEDKETLFTTVLQKHLVRIHEEQPFTPDDLPGYAAKVFDWARANPAL